MLSLLFLIACDNEKKLEWKTTNNGVKIYIQDTLSNFLSSVTYFWDGDSLSGLAHGTGVLAAQSSGGEILFSKRMRAYYGNFDKEIVRNKKNSYFGESEDGQAEGFGVMTQSSFVYVGDFKEGEGNGLVVVYKDDTLFYAGEWKSTIFNGKGKLFYPNGKVKYDGQWSDGVFNGRGIYYDEQGIPHKHVWKDGQVPDYILQRYQFLEEHKSDISSEVYSSLEKYYYYWEVAYIWIYLFAALLLISLVFILRKQYETSSLKRYNEIKPLDTASLYYRWVLGGIWGLHRVRLVSKFYIVEYILFAILFIVNVDNLFLYLLHPSVWFVLPQWGIVTKITASLCFFLWIYDAFWLPYGRYLFISKYFRRSAYEWYILNGHQTYLEAFYIRLAPTIDLRNRKLKELLEEAKECATRENPVSDWKKYFGGGLKFEKNRFNEMQDIAGKMNLKFSEFSQDAATVKDYLYAERIAAQRNFYLAKELIQIIHTLKGKKQTLQEDELSISQLNIDIKVPDEGAMDKVISETVTNMCQAYNSLSAMGGNVFALTGAGIVAVAGILEHVADKREELANKSLEIVRRMEKNMDQVMKSQAQLLRASELLSALFNANKAFVQAYVQLRDLCFGDISYASFRRGTIKEQDAYNTTEFKQAIQHLINVCNEYNKINQQVIKK